MSRTRFLMSRALPLTALLAVAIPALGPNPAQATAQGGSARVTLSCEDNGTPVDVTVCLAESRLDISREGEQTAYRAGDLATLDDPSDGSVSLTMPHNFSVRTQNTAPDALLTLTVAAPNGEVVHTSQARRFGWVQFYHCGPQVNPTCRDYRTPAK